MTDLFQYTPGNSPLHRMNPVTKIALTFFICVAAFLTNNLFVLLFLLFVDLMIGVIGCVPRKAFSIFRGLVKVSLFLFVLQALFVRRGTRIFWIITDQGLHTAVTVVLRLLVVCLPLALILDLMEEMSGIMEAQTARGIEFDTKNILKKSGMLLPLCAPLLISSVRQTGATATAARVRGFSLRTAASGYKKYGFRFVDLYAAVTAAALIAASLLIR